MAHNSDDRDAANSETRHVSFLRGPGVLGEDGINLDLPASAPFLVRLVEMDPLSPPWTPARAGLRSVMFRAPTQVWALFEPVGDIPFPIDQVDTSYVDVGVEGVVTELVSERPPTGQLPVLEIFVPPGMSVDVRAPWLEYHLTDSTHRGSIATHDGGTVLLGEHANGAMLFLEPSAKVGREGTEFFTAAELLRAIGRRVDAEHEHNRQLLDTPSFATPLLIADGDVRLVNIVGGDRVDAELLTRAQLARMDEQHGRASSLEITEIDLSGLPVTDLPIIDHHDFGELVDRLQGLEGENPISDGSESPPTPPGPLEKTTRQDGSSGYRVEPLDNEQPRPPWSDGKSPPPSPPDL